MYIVFYLLHEEPCNVYVAKKHYYYYYFGKNQKCLNLGQKMPYLSILGLDF